MVVAIPELHCALRRPIGDIQTFAGLCCQVDAAVLLSGGCSAEAISGDHKHALLLLTLGTLPHLKHNPSGIFQAELGVLEPLDFTIGIGRWQDELLMIWITEVA